MKKSILSVKGLTKDFGQTKALDNLNFQVEQGETYGLLGPNGAGKSTTIACILGLIKLTSGQVQLLNQDMSQAPRSIFEAIGVQFQQNFFPDRIKVDEMCQLVASLYKEPLDYQVLLEEFGLGCYKKRDVATLSGGERQKLSVLLALINQPQIVFLDELTTGLDPHARREVWDLLQTLKSKGLTIFLTSHYMEEVMVLCDRVNIINKGHSLVEDTPENIIKHTQVSDFETAYLSIIEKGENHENILNLV